MTLYPDKSLTTATRRDQTPNRFSHEKAGPDGTLPLLEGQPI
jgi:hypothetical protein